MALATRWLGSQNCRTRLSLRRFRANAPGALQSVGRIGSQTASTTNELSSCLLNTSSTAEAPRRQVGHVGESKRMTRRLDDARLNSACTAASVEPVISTNGG